MKTKVKNLLNKLGVGISLEHGDIDIHTPVDGSVIASIKTTTPDQQEEMILKARKAFLKWRDVPAPERGEVVRTFGNILRENKEDLAELVTIECGKIVEEARGEVQEMIDVCDFAVGLSRQLYGLTIQSERPQHVMAENWLPLGVVGIISTFNFPVAVWAWNAALAWVCGDTVIWKPSEKTPLTALASHHLFLNALKACGKDWEGISNVVIGEKDSGKALVSDRRIALISATGSVPMGKAVAPIVAGRFGKLLLELGGNNAAIVTPSADLDVALPSILFGAVGTSGQRCTSTRRLFAHHSIYDKLFQRLLNAYKSVQHKIGTPLDPHTLIGPLIDQTSYENMQNALAIIKKQGGEIFGGERVLEKEYPDAYYVTPPW
jgi:aldehyde dehydrogenase (NAD+)